MSARPALRDQLRARIGPYSPLIAFYRRHRPAWWWLRVNAVGRMTGRLVGERGTTVLAGAFEGLRYPQETVGHVGFLAPKLLGAYEQEVAGALRDTDWATFVDIGAAEGYFAVGMARTAPAGTVVAFEADPNQQRWVTLLARENGATVDLRGSADLQVLRDLRPEGPVALLCDVEGAEWDLVDPVQVPWMAAATIVVELHEGDRPGVTDELRRRCEPTHEVELVIEGAREIADHPALAAWGRDDAALALNEGRGVAGRWLIMRPRAPA